MKQIQSEFVYTNWKKMNMMMTYQYSFAVQTSREQELSTHNVNDVIFLLSVADIVSRRYSVEGIENVFYVHYRRVDGSNPESFVFSSFPSEISLCYLLMEDLQTIQETLYKQLNNGKQGQKLTSRDTMRIHPCS